MDFSLRFHNAILQLDARDVTFTAWILCFGLADLFEKSHKQEMVSAKGFQGGTAPLSTYVPLTGIDLSDAAKSLKDLPLNQT